MMNTLNSQNSAEKANYSLWKLFGFAGAPGVLLLLRCIIYLIFARGRADADAYATMDGTAIIFVLHTCLCLWFCTIFFTRSENKNYFSALFHKTPLRWFVCFSLIALASTVWSVVPLLSAYRAIECLALFGVIIGALLSVMRRGGYEAVIEWLLLYTLVCALIRVADRLAAGASQEVIWMASQMSATVFFYLALYCGRHKILRIGVIIFSIFSQSTTAYIGMTIGLLSLFWQKQYRILILPGGIFLICILLMTVGGEALLKNTVFSQRTEISWQATSGRDRLLERVWVAFQKSPVIGYGFFAGEPYTFRQDGIGAGVINAHNSLSSAALGTGLLGLIPLLLFFIGFGRLTFAGRLPDQYRGALIGCFCVALAQSMGNPGIGSRVYGSWEAVMMLLVMIALFSFEYSKEEVTS